MNAAIDSYRHRGMRNKLVDELKSKGIKDARVLSVISKIPRHLFLDAAFADWAYRDVAFPIGSDQTISQPYTVAFQTELLQTKPKDVVLEIGTGSGYQACVLHDLVKRVYSIERQETLYSRTSRLLEKLGYGMIRNMLGDGFAGLPRFAPFDKILVTCGANKIPQELLSQLKEGGMMVIPVGAKNQRMIRITRNGDQFTEEDFGPFQFVPMLEGINKFDLSKVKSRSNAR